MATGGGGQSARSLLDPRLPAEQRVRAARSARSGRASRPPAADWSSSSHAQHADHSRPRGQRRWRRRTGQVEREQAIAWTCRLTACAIARRGERRPWIELHWTTLRAVRSLTCCRFRWRAGGWPARSGDYWKTRQHLLTSSGPSRTRTGCFDPEIGAKILSSGPIGLDMVRGSRAWMEGWAQRTQHSADDMKAQRTCTRKRPEQAP